MSDAAVRWPLYTAAVLRPLLEQAALHVAETTFVYSSDMVAQSIEAGDQPGLLAWDRRDPPPHEQALIDAARSGGVAADDLLAMLIDVGAIRSRHAMVLQDVVRFDGVTHAWQAMAVERAADIGMSDVDVRVLADVRQRFASLLQPHAAADGSLRIPVRAALLLRL